MTNGRKTLLILAALGGLLCAGLKVQAVEDITKPLYSFPPQEHLGHTGDVNAVAYSPDGRWVVSASDDHTLIIWNAETGVEQQTLRGHNDAVTAVAYSPDGRFIASGSVDDTMIIWDVATGTVLQSHTDNVNAVAYSPDGRFIAFGSGGTVKIWEVATGAELNMLSNSDVSAIAYSPDGQFITSSSQDGTVNIWDAATGAKINSLKGNADARAVATAVAYSPDGRFIASNSFIHGWGGMEQWGDWESEIKIWDAATGAELNTLNTRLNALAYSPDGRFIASGSSYKTINIWDAATGVRLNTFQHTAGINAVAYSPDGRFIASGSDDDTVQIWPAQAAIEAPTLHTTPKYTLGVRDNMHQIKALTLSPDGRFITSGDSTNTIKIWDATTGIEQRTLSGHIGNVYAVTYSPDGRFFASGRDEFTLGGSNYIVKIWDIATGIVALYLRGHQRPVTSVTYSPDGHFMASGSDDKTVKIWDATTGTALHTLSGHLGTILALVYSPDGHFIASSSWDDIVILWNADTGEAVRRFKAHSKSINGLAFSPTGRRIYSGSDDRTIKVWDSGIVTTPLLRLPKEQVLGVGELLQIMPLEGDSPLSWESANENIATITQEGVVTAVSEGNVQMTAYDADGISQSTLVKVSNGHSPPSFGRALIIAGGGAHPSNTLFPYTQDLTQRMYRLLRDRGFSDEEIVYFTPAPIQDLEGDGYNDNVADDMLQNPLAELEQAFQEIAASLLPGQQFVLYLHGHADAHPTNPNSHPTVRLNQDTEITVAQLKALLALIPSHTQQILMFDTSYSGAFIEALQAENRLILASATAEGMAWNAHQENFSHFFIHELFNGKTLGQAFSYTYTQITSHPLQYGGQKPLLDDRKKIASLTRLGRQAVGAVTPPEILDLPPLSTLSASADSRLWVKTYPPSDARIRRVRAHFMPLRDTATENVRYDGYNTVYQPISADLTYQADTQRWEWLLSPSFTSGSWRVMYEAQDMNGVWSLPKAQEIVIESKVPQLGNISARCYMQNAPDNAVAGFVIEGMGRKRVLIRAIRSGIESNTDFDLSLELMQLVDGQWQALESNQYWMQSEQAENIGQLPTHLIPQHINDAALLMSLSPGVYTAIASPTHNIFGIGMVSVDDLDAAEDVPSASRLVNISGRCAVQNAPHHAVAGFVVQGAGSLNTLLRGIRSAADTSGVYDPKATLYRINAGTGQVLDTNNNWSQHARASEIAALPAHLMPSHTTDTALLRTLEAGVYTFEIMPESGAGIGMNSVDVVE